MTENTGSNEYNLQAYGVENRGDQKPLPGEVKQPTILASKKGIGELHEETEAQETDRLRKEITDIIDRITGDITTGKGTYTDGSDEWKAWKVRKKQEVGEWNLDILKLGKQAYLKEYEASLAPVKVSVVKDDSQKPGTVKTSDVEVPEYVENASPGAPFSGWELSGDQNEPPINKASVKKKQALVEPVSTQGKKETLEQSLVVDTGAAPKTVESKVVTTEYKVRPGDSLWGIVRKNFPELKSNKDINEKVNEIVKANNIANRDELLKGQVLKIK